MKNLILTISVFFLLSCNSENTDTQTKNTALNDPTYLDDLLVNKDGTINLALSDSASVLYNKAYHKNTTDSIAPYYLMKSADIQRHIPGKALLAIKKYLQLANQYPEHKLAPYALFMTGLTFDENLNDKARAAMVYMDFVKKYPEHEMANEAQNLLALAQDTENSDLEKVHEWMNEVEKNE